MTPAINYLPWPAAPALPPPPESAPPAWPTTRYRIASPYWSGELDVRDSLLSLFTQWAPSASRGEWYAVAFTVWGTALIERRDALWELFKRHPYVEVRRQFVESIQFEKIT
jgi:hypothetical protein